MRYMSRPRHKNKHIEAAVRYAESLGWTFKKCKGHAWGSLYCPGATRQSCLIYIYSTPRVPENHARQIRREIDLCPHGTQEHDQEDQEENDENGEQDDV